MRQSREKAEANRLLVEELGLLWPFCLFLGPAAELALPEQEGEHGRTPLG